MSTFLDRRHLLRKLFGKKLRPNSRYVLLAVSAQTDSESATLCPLGSYCTGYLNTNAVFCSGTCTVYCPVGSIQPESCPAGYLCPTPLTAGPCAAGFYCPLLSCTNVTCPVDYVCPEGSVAPVPPGCGNYTVLPGASNAIACSPGTFCPNDYSTSNTSISPALYSGPPCPANKPVWSSLVVNSSAAVPQSIATSCQGVLLVVGLSTASFANLHYYGGSSDMIAAAFNETTGDLLRVDDLGGTNTDAWAGSAFNPSIGAFGVIGTTMSGTVAGISTPGMPALVWVEYNSTGYRQPDSMQLYSCGPSTVHLASVAPASSRDTGGLLVSGYSNCYFLDQTMLPQVYGMLLVLNSVGTPVLQITAGTRFTDAIDAVGMIIAVGYPGAGTHRKWIMWMVSV